MLATPIGPSDTAELFAGYADQVVLLETPVPYFAVGQAYRNFDQTSDDEVIALLRNARNGFRAIPWHPNGVVVSRTAAEAAGTGSPITSDLPCSVMQAGDRSVRAGLDIR
ncbi:hypothetical protein [Mycobacterium angelicum]|uniref:Uncharacterized protein n=1 Tax=Mycobacterium angelicum TaxID=470074 RepID=A0A1W9ZRT2_MYCAN|nr:hypothetical protein BST12_15185 [Mycobacterium angelicum]